MSVIRINKFEAKEGMATGLHEFLMSVVPLVKQSQGCTSCQVLQNQESRNEFVVIEVWDLYVRFVSVCCRCLRVVHDLRTGKR